MVAIPLDILSDLKTLEPETSKGITARAPAPLLKGYGAGQPMIGTVLMLFCGLPATTRSL
jgi:hypothetical protein